MVRTWDTRRAAASSKAGPSGELRMSWWKQASELIMALSMAMGGASTGKPSKWWRNPSCKAAFRLILARKSTSSTRRGRRPKTRCQATSTKSGCSTAASSSMGIPR